MENQFFFWLVTFGFKLGAFIRLSSPFQKFATLNLKQLATLQLI